MKILIGKVVSTKMSKTATVAVDRIVVHPLYKKRYKRVKKYHVHDEVGVNVGQTVRFVASKPYSKLKRWRIMEAVDIRDKRPTTQKVKRGPRRIRKGETQKAQKKTK